MTPEWPKWLKDLMAQKSLNNKGLATLLKVAPSTVGNWVDGGKPEADKIIRLAELARENPVDLFGMIYDIGIGDDRERPSRDAEIESMIDRIMELPPADRRALREIVETMLRRMGKG